MSMCEPQEAVVVDVKHLTKSFGNKVALKDISLCLEAGTVYAAVGANGSGKTTSLRILAGILAADGGEGHILGLALHGALFALRAHVGYMTQHYSLYQAFSVQENLLARARLYGLRQPRHAVAALLEACALSAIAKERVGTLSGGWMRRVQFAAALVHQPHLLLLDEPTAGLDLEAKHALWERIHQLAVSGTTILVSTHDLEEAATCHRIGVFVEGTMAAQGAATDLLQHSGASVWQVPAGHVNAALLQRHLPDLVSLRQVSQAYHLVFRQQASAASLAWLTQQGVTAQAVPATLGDALAILTRAAKDRQHGA